MLFGNLGAIDAQRDLGSTFGPSLLRRTLSGNTASHTPGLAGCRMGGAGSGLGKGPGNPVRCSACAPTPGPKFRKAATIYLQV